MAKQSKTKEWKVVAKDRNGKKTTVYTLSYTEELAKKKVQSYNPFWAVEAIEFVRETYHGH